ncbi:hypothetical protein QN357_13890 [Cryobacterium sp. RTC2.1]|uniref:hypothetical protein n=1 Tax=Cryobacterium sp. RTC2.1 TaxID=3048634 RepID=UPI002B2374AF|nr:hypothetical protein [Cryobacterium sp. RTC2.1]MEB0004018.1 hypothetical protein [Cryobacterium sp. RTC2.1]
MTSQKTTTNRPSLVLAAAPAHPLRYPIHLRINDVVAGFRDGRSNLVDTAPRAESPMLESRIEEFSLPTWLRSNSHQFAERAGREYLVAHQDSASNLEAIRASAAEMLNLQTIRDAAAADLSSSSLDPASISGRLPSESDLTDEAVSVRRRREHDLLLARTTSRLALAERALGDASQTVARLTSEVITNYECLVGRVEVLREFHNRRATAYQRSFMRRFRRTCLDQNIAGFSSFMRYRISLPEWCTSPCPWLVGIER